MAQAKTNHITVMVKPAHSSEAATATRNPPAAMMLGFVGVSDRPRGGPQVGSTVGRLADSGASALSPSANNTPTTGTTVLGLQD